MRRHYASAGAALSRCCFHFTADAAAAMFADFTLRHAFDSIL